MDEIELSVCELSEVTNICSELYNNNGINYQKIEELTYLIDKAKEVIRLAEKEHNLLLCKSINDMLKR